MEQANPGRVVLPKQVRVFVALGDEEEGLAEAEHEDDVDDAEGGHVSQDHAVYHDHEGAGQWNSSAMEKEYFLIEKCSKSSKKVSKHFFSKKILFSLYLRQIGKIARGSTLSRIGDGHLS